MFDIRDCDIVLFVFFHTVVDIFFPVPSVNLIRDLDRVLQLLGWEALIDIFSGICKLFLYVEFFNYRFQASKL